MPIPYMLDVGFYNYVVTNQIVALVGSDSAPIRRLIQQLRNTGQVIDATQGRKTKCVIFTLANQIVLSAMSQETLAKRLGSGESIGERE
ncbi:MAG TPA: DUF370 domain-containing protein [Fimbriimonadales bacterium]|nr:DUF370 domain-containing protein [Fimbriimonadales bacterium]